ncbi:PAAR domain-containing protein [Vibrio fluvialis]|uniref:PAAR domain-containing protein n=1 Tax=Vibrio fluvialis TaxID=676 RepID=UPI001EEC5A12|nr:PAAR domain-containing protein [Vibrio fluvialis]EKO3443205.1 PAAR domain-containing protein [Vibrio fluvialis]EKO3995238.1 type VI secretion protein [Vibrio fluvialis]MCG6404648.1 PAAR domain-containing protein [Vibrio fluvialis]
MGMCAARLTDMHTCPMATGSVPHVGGPIIGPSVATVLIGSLPAAVVGDSITCVGPPDTIAAGSTSVLINSTPAARLGDSTSHGGAIVAGAATVLIG